MTKSPSASRIRGLPAHNDPTELEPRPDPAPLRAGSSTGAQLRRDVESGATHDKVRVLDPAAAPLGTDDEAAGVREDPGLVAADRRAGRSMPDDLPPVTTGASQLPGWLVLAGTALCMVMAVAGIVWQMG
jgi:hypothetical protein